MSGKDGKGYPLGNMGDHNGPMEHQNTDPEQLSVELIDTRDLLMAIFVREGDGTYVVEVKGMRISRSEAALLLRQMSEDLERDDFEHEHYDDEDGDGDD